MINDRAQAVGLVSGLRHWEGIIKMTIAVHEVHCPHRNSAGTSEVHFTVAAEHK